MVQSCRSTLVNHLWSPIHVPERTEVVQAADGIKGVQDLADRVWSTGVALCARWMLCFHHGRCTWSPRDGVDDGVVEQEK